MSKKGREEGRTAATFDCNHSSPEIVGAMVLLLCPVSFGAGVVLGDQEEGQKQLVRWQRVSGLQLVAETQTAALEAPHPGCSL